MSVVTARQSLCRGQRVSCSFHIPVALAEMEKCRVCIGMRTGSPSLCSHHQGSRTSFQRDHRKSMITLCQQRGKCVQQMALNKRAAENWITLEGNVTFWSLQRIHSLDIITIFKCFFLLDYLFLGGKKIQGRSAFCEVFLLEGHYWIKAESPRYGTRYVLFLPCFAANEPDLWKITGFLYILLIWCLPWGRRAAARSGSLPLTTLMVGASLHQGWQKGEGVWLMCRSVEV